MVKDTNDTEKKLNHDVVNEKCWVLGDLTLFSNYFLFSGLMFLLYIFIII